MGALLARIEHAVNKVKAKRVVQDSLGAIFAQLEESHTVREEIYRIAWALKKMQITSIMTAERQNEFGDITRYGMEQLVADNVIILRNFMEVEKRRRTVEILKFRGAVHQKGKFPFTILPNEGMVAIPMSAIDLKQRSSDVRLTSGNAELDSMCGSGFFRDSIILASGATGTGKTLLVSQFIDAARKTGERCLLFAFEESRGQLIRNARGWGFDFEELERRGLLRIVCTYPEAASLEDHQLRMKEIIEEHKPQRIGIDSFSALERVSTGRVFREFVIGITSHIKHLEIVALCTATTRFGNTTTSITEEHISTITHSIILLRYVEIFGEMHRGLTVLKMRGSHHDREIREFTIDGQGLHIGDAFRNVSGILTDGQGGYFS